MGELSGKLQASSAALTELDGELRAAEMAAEAEEAAAEKLRRQLAATDALIQRLMAAVAEQQGRGSKGAAGAAPSAASLSAASPAASTAGTSSTSAASPQSSIGSVAPPQLAR